MRLGIFAKTFVRPTLAETLDAVVAHKLDCIQFNFACVGMPSVPEEISLEMAAQIGGDIAARGITVAGVSGTFNIIDPDLQKRAEGLGRFEAIAARACAIGTSLITICTGTRDAQDMWRHHPDNDSPKTWAEMLASLRAMISIAERHDIFIGVEPEIGNVVSSAKKARQLLDELKSPRLKIVIDASNLFHPNEQCDKEDILSEAFALLGPDIVMAHAKDVQVTEALEYVAPGQGDVPWYSYIMLLRQIGFSGPLVLHGLAESEVADSLQFLRHTEARTPRLTAPATSQVFEHDGIQFHYQEKGRGIPFFFQHGLGGEIARMFSLFQPPEGFRMLAMDCRGHGRTAPFGPDEKIGIASFADDVRALMDHLGIASAIMGGTSMGAAVSLNFALRFPERVRGLILQRPAWLDKPRHENVGVYVLMAKLIREHGPERGLELFQQSPIYQTVEAQSQASAKSLSTHFTDPRALETVALIERIPLDAPNRDRKEWKRICVPTLVLANREDLVHPFEYGETLAAEIPGAELCELTPKNRNADQHNAEIQSAIEKFLLRHF